MFKGPFRAQCVHRRMAIVGCMAMGLGTVMFNEAVHAAAPDSARVAALEGKLDQSLALIAQLASRVRELEEQAQAARPQPAAGTAPPALGSAGDTSNRLAVVERQVEQISSAHAHSSTDSSGIPLHGFADVGVGNHNALNELDKGAAIGSLDFFLTPQLGARTRSLFELNFEVGDEGEVDVDLERAQLGYQFSDAATVWFGRFHTPYGYYNTAVHHGQQISTALRRPKFLQFEDQGGVLPAHTVGAWLTGARRLGEQRLTYDLYVGNAQTISNGTIDMRNGGTEHGNITVGGGAGLHMSGPFEGLKVGAEVLRARIADDSAVQHITRLDAYGLYVAYDTDRWENIGEVYLFDDHDLSGASGNHRSEAGFVQLAYRAGFYTPYLRYERAALKQADPFFAALDAGGSYYRDALGLRFDIDVKSALKFELAKTTFTDRMRRDYSDILVQYAIRF